MCSVGGRPGPGLRNTGLDPLYKTAIPWFLKNLMWQNMKFKLIYKIGKINQPYCKVNCILIVITILFAQRLFILKHINYNFPFALSCIGNKPPQVFMVAVDRFQEFKSPNQSFFLKSIHYLPNGLLNLHNLGTIDTQHYGKGTGEAWNTCKHVV